MDQSKVREAMKQALEALESATPKYTRQRKDQKTLGGALDYWKLAQDQRMKAITALRQALEQPAAQWVGLTDEEIDELVKKRGWHELIKATEVKLKEKNTC